MSRLQAQIASILQGTFADEGFAIGGGLGLQAHGVIDRESADIDAYTATFDPKAFIRVEQKVMDRISDAGLLVSVSRALDVFREFIVCDPISNEQTTVDLGYDHRDYPPTVLANIGPVLKLDLSNRLETSFMAWWSNRLIHYPWKSLGIPSRLVESAGFAV